MPEFLYENKPDDFVGETSNPLLTKQTDADNVQLFKGSMSAKYQNWATFEKGEFDFFKPLYNPDYAQAWTHGIGIMFTSKETSDENGNLGEKEYIPETEETIIHYPRVIFSAQQGTAYSGGGISLKTNMDYYEISILIRDYEGQKSKTFVRDKTHYADEFFPFAFDGLSQVVVYFEKIKPFHFIKVYGIGLGGTRIINNSDLVEFPTLTTHFSMTNEELEMDTLSFRIVGDKESFNFVAGEKIFDVENQKDFYVESASYNTDGTIDVEAYDRMVLLDEADYSGMMRKNSPTLTDNLLKQAPYVIEESLNKYEELRNELSYSGTLSNEISKREALRIFLQGNGISMRRIGNTFSYFYNFYDAEDGGYFRKTDLCSPVEIEKLDVVNLVRFSKHKFVVDTSQGKVEAFRDNVPRNEETTISYGEPYTSQTVYYDDNGTLRELPQSQILESGAYFRTINTPRTEEIVVTGYPYKTNYSYIKAAPSAVSNFKSNRVEISDCSICTDDKDFLVNFLQEAYSYKWELSFSSLKNVNVGFKVNVYFRDDIRGRETYIEGVIVEKQDSYNGIYRYKVHAIG